MSAAVLGFGIATLVALWLLTLRQIDLERELALQAEIDKNSNLVLAHAERASRSIQVLDQVLLAVRTDYLRHGAASDLAELVDALWTDAEHLGLVALVDENGDFVKSYPAGRINVRDRDYFQHHLAVPEDRLLVGKPILGRVIQDWVVTLSRRVEKPDGSFGGVVLSLMARSNSPTRGHPKFPQAGRPDYDDSGLTAMRAAASFRR